MNTSGDKGEQAHALLSDVLRREGEDGAEDVLAFFRRRRPSSAEEFLRLLYEDLDAAVRNFGQRRLDFRRVNDKGEWCEYCEDEISNHLVAQLRIALECTVVREAGEQGHVDITIKHLRAGFEWLGEAKKDGGPATLLKGMKQLWDRYLGGQEAGCGMLVYNFHPDSSARMAAWRSHLEVKGAEVGWISDDDDCAWAFCSRHRHEGTGTKIDTRHIYFSLFDKRPAPKKRGRKKKEGS